MLFFFLIGYCTNETHLQHIYSRQNISVEKCVEVFLFLAELSDLFISFKCTVSYLL